MSDAAITTIVTGIVTIAMSTIGFLTLWVRLKYGEKETRAVKEKVAENTDITAATRDATSKVAAHVTGCDKERAALLKGLTDHDVRITALEGQMAALKVSVDGVTRNVDSTRHEMRSHLQTLSGKLDLLALARAPVTQPAPQPAAQPPEESK